MEKQPTQPTTEEDIRNHALRARNSLTIHQEQFLTTWAQTGPQKIKLTIEEEKKAILEGIRIAIDKAESQKGYDLYKELYGRNLTEEKQFPVLTFEKFASLIYHMGVARSIEQGWDDKFAIDNDNRQVVNALALYFTDDPRFEQLTPGFSLRKGLLIIGPVGCGKTELLELCSRNPKMSFTRHNCISIARKYSKSSKEGGEEIIEELIKNSKVGNLDITMGKPFAGRFFDDLGAEANGKSYGLEKNVMGEIIQERYSTLPYNQTFYTSNLQMPAILEMYGDRVHDRLKQTCNIIYFSKNAKSRRR